MTLGQRDKLLYKVLRLMRFADDHAERYRLYCVGEELLGSSKDLDYEEQKQLLEEK
jgi:hypothetical protein